MRQGGSPDLINLKLKWIQMEREENRVVCIIYIYIYISVVELFKVP